jgi:STE24 endopeptidase
MTDEQIEAVFAHEIGHIVHRHMNWYLVFIVALALVSQCIDGYFAGNGPYRELIYIGSFLVKFLVLFGFVSRRFERQADVFAARSIQANLASRRAELAGASAADRPVSEPESFDGEYGAMLFGSALHRVAAVNNIPVAARSWCHGSIGTRMSYLRRLSGDPERTRRFDSLMRWLYLALLVWLAGAGVMFVMMM